MHKITTGITISLIDDIIFTTVDFFREYLRVSQAEVVTHQGFPLLLHV